MAIVTLLTDSGSVDHYVAAIKAKILSVNPGVHLVDISHQISVGDIAHGAFVLRSVFRDFPAGTVHLVGVDSTGRRDDVFVAMRLENHFFVGVDNGLFGLISDQTPQQVVQLISKNTDDISFPEKDILAPAAARLASNVSITALGKLMPALKRITNRQIKANKRIISGNVIRVDHFGNLITNISKDTFETLSLDRRFIVQFGGEKFKKIHKNYFEADPGDCVLLFNSLGFLEIAVYRGNASELLGLQYDSPVNIIFDE